MPAFQKRSLSLYLRNRCERQFLLYLYSDKERAQLNMPLREQRGGLGIVGQAGYEWQYEKVRELQSIFGALNVHEDPTGTPTNPRAVELLAVLPLVQPYQFIVEGAYAADTQAFRNALGIQSLVDYYGTPIGIGDTRPDIIQVLPSVLQGGTPPTDTRPNPYQLAVTANGRLVWLNDDDTRLRLRIIDVKLTAEPGANYFAEVVYYSMTLAAWLEENNLADRFAVVSAPAVWPGSHEASHLAEQRSSWQREAHIPTAQELVSALEKDLELAVFDVFAPRLRNVLTEELPQLLSKPWDELGWHVDHRCKGCEFLSASLKNENPEPREKLRCYPTAEQMNALSRVTGLSRGATDQLRMHSITNVTELAVLDATSAIFDNHQGLKSKRTSFPHRAKALIEETTSIIPDSGGDALMPKWPALRIYAFLDYDLSSAITASLAIRAEWREPLPYGTLLQPNTRAWTRSKGDDEIFLVDIRTVDRERQEFLKFLRRISEIIKNVRDEDAKNVAEGRRDKKTTHSTYQIYLWDESQKKHLVRLIGRHLPHVIADTDLRELAWLFPPPEILQDAREATRQSAITLLKTVVENTVAVDVPHYYGLIDLANRVKPTNYPNVDVHPLYREPFSDLIPMERLHEFWNRKGDWTRTLERIRWASQNKVLSVSYVAGWLQDQLKDVLNKQAAPPITPLPKAAGGLAPMSRLWLGFTKLNSAIESFDKHSTRAMPPHERAARFKSARLAQRLDGDNKVTALHQLNSVGETDLVDAPTLLIYEMHPDSIDVNIQRGDFLYALAPQSDFGFLDQNAFSLTKDSGFESPFHYQQTVETSGLTSVTVEAIDRINRLIAFSVELDTVNLIRYWEATGRFDFSKNVMLDPVHGDFLSKKVEQTLKAIGHPPSAPTDQRTREALGLQSIKQGKGAETPASEILWNAKALAQQETAIDANAVQPDLKRYLEQEKQVLDHSQWEAWSHALKHKLSLVWGPPGTGKSRTLRAIALGALLYARKHQQSIRLLISSNTYTAIDNVLLPLEEELRVLLSPDEYQIYRIQSSFRDAPSATLAEDHPTLKNVVFNRHIQSDDIDDLRHYLGTPRRLVIVGCPPQQLHNLAIGSAQKPTTQEILRRWFDFIIIDEASQIDIATGSLVLSKRADDSVCVIAGDDLQLPPIHQAEPPKDLEHAVGSLYGYFRQYHGILPVSLDVNYRSNRSIVEFTKRAGYSEKLHSFAPDLMLNLLTPVENERPEAWPSDLFWTPEWKSFLDPEYPAISFVYRDPLSAQVNDFEADAIAALIWLLRGRLADQLLNRLDPNNNVLPPSTTPYSVESFWQSAVGVVTPHRAQRSKVISRLRHIFADDPVPDIFGAVDTVERYQGQQRDVILASYGIGDPDLIESEDEFLYNLNRFNVLTSRARAKVIFFCPIALLQHLSNDIAVIEESRLLKSFVDAYYDEEQFVQLGYCKDSEFVSREGLLRRKL